MLGTHHLTLGLCREQRASTVNKGRALPSILQRPSDAHSPHDVPAITLAAIDIYLEYSYTPWLEEGFCDLMTNGLNSITELDQWNYQSKIGTFAVATLTVLGHETESAYSDYAPDRLNKSSQSYSTQRMEDNIPSSQSLLHLLDSGLQRLIISASSRGPQTRIVGKNTLQNLSQLFPAIFNPGYREVSHRIPQCSEFRILIVTRP